MSEHWIKEKKSRIKLLRKEKNMTMVQQLLEDSNYDSLDYTYNKYDVKKLEKIIVEIATMIDIIDFKKNEDKQMKEFEANINEK